MGTPRTTTMGNSGSRSRLLKLEADFDRRRTALPVARRAGIHKPPPERTSEPPAVKADDTTRELISSMPSSCAGRHADSLSKAATHPLPSRRRRDYNWLEQ